MSSRRLVPPVVAMTLTPPRCLAIWMEIWLTCRASSRVGTKTSAGKEKQAKVGGGDGRKTRDGKGAPALTPKPTPTTSPWSLTLDVVLLQVDPLQHGDEIGSTLACSILCPGQDVSSRQGDWNALLLQRHKTHRLKRPPQSACVASSPTSLLRIIGSWTMNKAQKRPFNPKPFRPRRLVETPGSTRRGQRPSPVFRTRSWM